MSFEWGIDFANPDIQNQRVYITSSTQRTIREKSDIFVGKGKSLVCIEIKIMSSGLCKF